MFVVEKKNIFVQLHTLPSICWSEHLRSNWILLVLKGTCAQDLWNPTITSIVKCTLVGQKFVTITYMSLLDIPFHDHRH